MENWNWLTTLGTAKMLADVLLFRVRNVAASARDINHLICLLSANANYSSDGNSKALRLFALSHVLAMPRVTLGCEANNSGFTFIA
jgi:hypothetical protein